MVKSTLILVAISVVVNGKTPIFKTITCPDSDTAVDLCISVDYDDILASHDLILSNALPQAPTVFKGRLSSNGNKVVVILKDSTNNQDTVSIIYE